MVEMHRAICLECGWREESDDVTESNYGEVSFAFIQGNYHNQKTGHRLIYMKDDEIMRIDLRDEEKDRLLSEDKMFDELVERAKKLGLNLWKQEGGGTKYRMSGYIRGEMRQGMFKDINSISLQLEKEEEFNKKLSDVIIKEIDERIIWTKF